MMYRGKIYCRYCQDWGHTKYLCYNKLYNMNYIISEYIRPKDIPFVHNRYNDNSCYICEINVRQERYNKLCKRCYFLNKPVGGED